MSEMPMLTRILHVEDSAEHRAIVGRTLQDLYTVVPALTMAEARAQIRKDHFDLILLDIVLPDGSGYDLCPSLQDGNGALRTPVIFLTGQDAATEVRQGLMAGGTDYITKPFNPAELRARIEARLRNATPAPDPTNDDAAWLRSGNLRLNLLKREVRIESSQGTRPLLLTPSEFRLLSHFTLHAGKTLSREQLLQDIWGPRSTSMSARAIDVHICQLRKKMPPGPCRIEAVYGEGYRYNDGRPEAN
jgi:DNA-binding response OmpR family regulator